MAQRAPVVCFRLFPDRAAETRAVQYSLSTPHDRSEAYAGQGGSPEKSAVQPDALWGILASSNLRN